MVQVPVSRHRDDRGIALVIVALSIVALLATVGLAIDGSRAYSLRRQTQNAADAAALDATKVLSDIQTCTTSCAATSTIYSTARARAINNGAADPGLSSTTFCRYVDFGRGDLGACPTSGHPALPDGVAGVKVSVSQSETTFFMTIVGKSSYSAGVHATAEIGKPEVTDGIAPIMVCGNNASGGVPIMQFDTSTGQYQVNPAARGLDYYVWGPQLHKVPGGDCLGAQWKGLVATDHDVSYSLPGVWTDYNGTKAGPTRSMLNDPNACTTGFTPGCTLLLPLCPTVDPEGRGLYCTDFGKFVVKSSSANSIDEAIFVGPTTLPSGGTGIIGPADPNGARRVVLTD